TGLRGSGAATHPQSRRNFTNLGSIEALWRDVMSLPDLSIRRPIFTASVFILILGIGYLALRRLPVDLFPSVTFPVVQVATVYPGAGPKEVETLISKPLEDEISTIAGIKTLRSINKDSVSVVVAAFNLQVDIKYAEQQVRDKVA